MPAFQVEGVQTRIAYLDETQQPVLQVLGPKNPGMVEYTAIKINDRETGEECKGLDV